MYYKPSTAPTYTLGRLEKGDQIVHGVFCQTFTKLCQIHCHITNNVAKILELFFNKRFTSTMDPMVVVLLTLI